MHRILDHKPDSESVVVSRLHSFVTEALERQFPHLRQPTSHFDSDEATVVTHSPYGFDEGAANKSQGASLATPGKGAAHSDGRVRRDGGGKADKATAHPKRQDPPRKSSAAGLPPEIPQGEKTYLVAMVSICALVALVVLWFASSFAGK